jgi:hypothetical protein
MVVELARLGRRVQLGDQAGEDLDGVLVGWGRLDLDD